MKDLLKQIKLISEITVSEKREVVTAHLSDDNMMENNEIINNVINYYNALNDFLIRAERASRYHRGDQWGDMVTNDDGDLVTEENAIIERGKIPLKNNMIGQIINNLSGQFVNSSGSSSVLSRKRSQQKGAEMLTQALRTSYDMNRVNILDTNTMIDGMITGLFVQKVLYKYYPELDQQDLHISKPNITRMFYNSDLTDPRMNEIRFIGELHDLMLDDVVMLFALNEEDEKLIRSWYSGTLSETSSLSQGLKSSWSKSVRLPDDHGKVRVIEVWRKVLVRRMREHDTLRGTQTVTKRTMQEVAEENDFRLKLGADNGVPVDKIGLIKAAESYEQVWAVKYLTPYGHSLYEGETPFHHQSHPYNMAFAQFVNGDAWGIVENIIDQQRYINRLINLLDFMMGTAAKGVLIVPEDSIPDDMRLDDIADEWSKFDGVIKLKLKAGAAIPQQISGNVTNIGANEQLAIQFDLIEKISGVSGAMQGQESKAGTPSSLYAQQALNSSTNSKALFETFNDFRKQRDIKALKVITQYYNDTRYLRMAGGDYTNEAVQYDKEAVKNLNYDVVLTDSVDTPIYRSIIDQQLQMLLEQGAINAEMYLENSSMPYADKLLESMRSNKEQAQQQNPEAQQAQQNANPETVAKTKEMLKIQ